MGDGIIEARVAALERRILELEAATPTGPGFRVFHDQPVSSVVPTGDGSGGEDKLRSFAFTLAGGPSVTIAKGNIHYSGKGTYLAAETGVTIAGTSGAPTRVYVRLPKSGTMTAEIVTSAVEEAENDTWWYFLLYTFYLDGSNNAVKDFDWRYDIRMGSPVGP